MGGTIMNRTVIACLIAVVLLTGVSNAQWGEISRVMVAPESPSINDEVSFHVSGLWGSSCIPQSMDVYVERQSIYIDVIWDYPPDVMCLAVISDWTLSKSIDPLPEGEYIVYTRIQSVTEYAKSAVFIVGFQRWYWPPTEVVISPRIPTSTDEVTVILQGDWLDTCVPTGVDVRREGREIFLDVLLEYDPGTGCGDAITPWRQEALLGTLDAGDYTIYGRIAENVMVPETEYVKLKELTVTFKRQGGVYLIVPKESSVTQTGGFMGINETYDLEGMFALEIDFEKGVAAFTEVDATLSPEGFLPTTSLGKLFNMQNLTSTSVSQNAIRFSGYTDDDAEVVIEAIFSNSGLQLVGRIRPGCCDRFDYDLDAFAEPLREPICKEVPRMDFTGDCRVDLADLAVFAQSWLECNLFPQSACR